MCSEFLVNASCSLYLQVKHPVREVLSNENKVQFFRSSRGFIAAFVSRSVSCSQSHKSRTKDSDKRRILCRCFFLRNQNSLTKHKSFTSTKALSFVLCLVDINGSGELTRGALQSFFCRCGHGHLFLCVWKGCGDGM